MFLGERHEIQLPPQDINYLTLALGGLIELPPGMVTVFAIRNIFNKSHKRIEKVPSITVIEESQLTGEKIEEALLASNPVVEIRQRGETFEIQYNPRFINPIDISEKSLRRGIEAARIYDQSRN